MLPPDLSNNQLTNILVHSSICQVVLYYIAEFSTSMVWVMYCRQEGTNASYCIIQIPALYIARLPNLGP